MGTYKPPVLLWYVSLREKYIRPTVRFRREGKHPPIPFFFWQHVLCSVARVLSCARAKKNAARRRRSFALPKRPSRVKSRFCERSQLVKRWGVNMKSYIWCNLYYARPSLKIGAWCYSYVAQVAANLYWHPGSSYQGILCFSERVRMLPSF